MPLLSTTIRLLRGDYGDDMSEASGSWQGAWMIRAFGVTAFVSVFLLPLLMSCRTAADGSSVGSDFSPLVDRTLGMSGIRNSNTSSADADASGVAAGGARSRGIAFGGSARRRTDISATGGGAHGFMSPPASTRRRRQSDARAGADGGGDSGAGEPAGATSTTTAGAAEVEDAGDAGEGNPEVVRNLWQSAGGADGADPAADDAEYEDGTGAGDEYVGGEYDEGEAYGYTEGDNNDADWKNWEWLQEGDRYYWVNVITGDKVRAAPEDVAYYAEEEVTDSVEGGEMD